MDQPVVYLITSPARRMGTATFCRGLRAGRGPSGRRPPACCRLYHSFVQNSAIARLVRIRRADRPWRVKTDPPQR
ncbi:hypothetical protein KCP71_09965 [Salmonella enterica subsp. enterica]|nr:hypothetical protein KCP71_09965 [Salmonella enterica subsp. enterica]